MADDMGERTEAPSSRKLTQARENGQVARSTELVAAVDLITAVILIVMFGAGLVSSMRSVLLRTLEHDTFTSGVDGISPLLMHALATTAMGLAPILLLILAAALGVHIAQVGWHFTTKPLMPDLARLNPLRGLGKLFNRRQQVRTGIGMIKVAIVGAISWAVLAGEVGRVTALPRLSLWAGLSEIGTLALRLAIWLLVMLFILGAADYLYQRWQHYQDLKMTKEEVKDERRSMEGDPKVKSQRFKLARQIALQRINQSVPKADVIVTNPTHYSVALQYDQATMKAPRVVAKGVDHMALRIRQVAMVHQVPMVERPPLARALYAAAEVGQEISPEFYEAVAEVLAYVYRLENKAA